MKKSARFAALALATVMGVAAFAGCTKKTDSSGTGSSGTDSSGTTSSSAPAYTVATNAQFPPYEFMDGATMVGLDVDLVNAIAVHAGFTCTMQDMEFDAVIPSVQTGACDFAASGLTITADRQQNVDFSDPYYVSHQEVIVRTGDAMANLTTADAINAALVGKTIGVCTGFTGSDYVTGGNGWDGIPNATAVQYDNIGLAITDLKNGQVDAVMMDNVPATQAASTDINKSAITVINVPLTDEDYAIAVKKGNTALLNQINAAIAQFKTDGTLDNLVQKWITDAQ
ncbi:MAG: transporter substrate-binding domain-containing protein [Oscillospiraceae bacterium]|nr:transporter substrate-binding domain-containing protein [Oscillospiraceae bacterium]